MNQLLAHATASRACADLSDYLTTYTGRLFDEWARPDLHRFVFDDIVAVQALSVVVPPEAAKCLLDDVDGTYERLITELSDRSLRDETEQWLEPANELHSRLKVLGGVGGVIAGKLMHAKLPSLIPIWDDKTDKGLQYPEGDYWESWRCDYTDEVRRAVQDLRNQVPLAKNLTDLRVLDIVVWKAHEDD